MNETYGLLSLLPPLLAIVLALRTRQVHLSLFLGVWIGTALLAGGVVAGGARAIESLVAVFDDAGNTRTILFTLVVGALIVLVRESGGVAGFAEWMVGRGWVRGPASAQMISALLGVAIFIESNITCLITGTVSRPLYDRVGISRAKLAYVCDSTSAPICMLIPINAWGALILRLLANEGVEDPLATLVAAVPLNFYALLALAMVFWVALTGWEIGPMRRVEEAAQRGEDPSRVGAVPETLAAAPEAGKRPHNLLLPVAVTIAVVPWVLYLTGEGDWTAGSGSTAVLWAVCAGVLAAMLLYRVQGLFGFVEMTQKCVRGFQELVPVAVILALALALGSVCRALGTGPFVAESVAPWLGPVTVAPLVFLAGCVIAFSTGSSWGTFAILMPIAVPLAQQAGSSVPLAVAAVMGGGIFGDHCSPISDTTVVSSMSAGCDHIDHVTTQLPYALVAGAGALVLYFVAGLLA